MNKVDSKNTWYVKKSPYADNRENCILCSKRWRERNREKVRQNQKEWYRKNRNKILLRQIEQRIETRTTPLSARTKYKMALYSIPEETTPFTKEKKHIVISFD